MPPHQQSKCCGCCCTSRIGVFVYCSVFGVLSLLGIVNFFPLPNSSLWFTFIVADVVSSADEYCNTYAISIPAEIGSGESFAGDQPPMSWESYDTPDCSGEPTWTWAEPTFPTDAASAPYCHGIDGGAIQFEWCDYSEEPPKLRGIYFAGISDCPSSDCSNIYSNCSGEEYAHAADGSCVVDGMVSRSFGRAARHVRFYCGVFKEEYSEEEYSVGRLGTCDDVCMCGDLPCDFAAQGAVHASGALLFFAATIMSIVLYIVGGVAACAYHKQALVVFAGGIVLVEILFLVSAIILTVAPTQVFKASFLWATASGYDPNGVAYCTDDWLTAVDGLFGFGTISRCTPRLSPATRPARPCRPPPPPARHRASERTQLALLRGQLRYRPRHLRPHALRGVQGPPRHHRGRERPRRRRGRRPDAGDGDGDGDGDGGARRDGDGDGGPDGDGNADGDGGAIGDGGRDGDGVRGERASEERTGVLYAAKAAPYSCA